MSTNTIVAYPAAQFVSLITAAVVANMNKEEGVAFVKVLSIDGKITLEVNDEAIVKLDATDLKTPDGKELPVGAKVYFNEDASLKEASFVAPKVKTAATSTATRTTGSYKEPKLGGAFGRE